MPAIRTTLFALALLFACPAWAAGGSAAEVGPETTLNAAAHRLDGFFTHTQAALELIATTPEARRGDWPGIKAYLRRLATDLPGVYFFVLPDGNYYSVDLDYTRLNLANRPYFASLFAGQPVRGFPIYSRSSGKKSALMAVPITVDGKVTGALGASIFLDELHARLNRELALPPGYTWFVLDAEGNTMLDRDIDFIFMNALKQGGDSLRAAVAEALRHDSGRIQYEIEGIRHGHYRRLASLDWWMVLVQREGGAFTAPPRLALSLDRFIPDLQGALDGIDASLARLTAARRVGVDNDAEVRALLGALLAENPAVIEAALVDRRGVLRQIEPGDYRNFENTDISDQAHVVAMRQNPAPVFSAGFRAVEGFLAVDLARPLHQDGEFVASVSALIRPELLVAPLVRRSVIPADHELWIMQPEDGMIIYDQDQDEIGRLLFGDPAYAGYHALLGLGHRIARHDSGEGSYIFVAPAGGEKVIKKAVWQTVRLHGREWRVVLAYRPYER